MMLLHRPSTARFPATALATAVQRGRSLATHVPTPRPVTATGKAPRPGPVATTAARYTVPPPPPSAKPSAPAPSIAATGMPGTIPSDRGLAASPATAAAPLRSIRAPSPPRHHHHHGHHHRHHHATSAKAANAATAAAAPSWQATPYSHDAAAAALHAPPLATHDIFPWTVDTHVTHDADVPVTADDAFRGTPLDPHDHFYASRVLEQYARQEPTRVTLRQLVYFGRHMSEHKLLKSANYLRTELPVRLAHRLRDLQTSLPYIAVANPHLAAIYADYWSAFNAFRAIKPIESMAENRAFCDLLRNRLREHRTVIPRLALGLLECEHRGIVSAAQVDSFMGEMLRSRIGRRVLAQQHLALSDAFTRHHRAHPNVATMPDPSDDAIGIVRTDLSAAQCVERAATAAAAVVRAAGDSHAPVPHVAVVGATAATLPYVADHLEYVLLELLKNAMAATLARVADENNGATPTAAQLAARPITVTICEGPADVLFRISDMGGGVPRHVLPYLFSFAHRAPAARQQLAATKYFTGTVQEQVRRARPLEFSTRTPLPVGRLGLGCPLSKVYAEYWGGSLDVYAMDGYGTDAYLRVGRLGTATENVNVQAAIAVDAK
ncbi:hypothetical protein GGF32_001165 [Allomyces javanicus]|nr:hypothetical protein GGF32_001165 [Allomyces javanicus]